MEATRDNLLDFPQSDLVELFSGLGEKPYRARQVMKWIYHHGCVGFDTMTDLSKHLRGTLEEQYRIEPPAPISSHRSSDGTRKWLFDTIQGAVETVLIPDRGRNTLCVSSQVGCALDCSFCATGKQGYGGDLSTADIIGQVYQVARVLEREGDSRGVTNVVLMGMGEPLLNLNNVLAATSLMMDDLAFGISKRRVTISTAGVAPAIRELRSMTDVSLAISLHAPNDALRNELVPLNRRYPIGELLDACRYYLSGLGDKRSLTMEYTLLSGVNDSIELADELAGLLRELRCKINLIPFNPYRGARYETPSIARVRQFQKRLLDHGHAAMLRLTRGDDIGAACGQLVGQFQDRTRRRERHARLAEEVPSARGTADTIETKVVHVA